MLELVFGVLVQLLILGAVIGGVVYGIMLLRRRGGELSQPDPGIGTVRRLYFYGVSFVALMMAASGTTEILHFVLDELAGSPLVQPSRVRLAVGLSLSLVGLPLWALHWWLISRRVRDIPAELRSVVRKVYIYVVLAVGAGLWTATAITTLQWLFGNRTFSGYSAAAIVVWGAVWALHWRIEAAEGQSTPETRAVRRIYLYVVAAGMLIAATLGIGLMVHLVFRQAYDSLTSAPLIVGSGLWIRTTKVALSMALVATPIWAVNWLYFARHDYESTLRRLYLYLFTLLGAVITILITLMVMLNGALVWAFGAADRPAGDHFGFIPAAVASLIIGGLVLAFHGLVARQEAEASPSEAQGAVRSLPYLMAAVGLGALVVGTATLLTSAIGILTESGRVALAGGDVWRKAVALGATLVLLGGPLWGYYWAQVQRGASAGDGRARTLLVRRGFIFTALGAGMLALLGSVSFLLFVFLKELLDGDLSDVLRDTRVSIGILATAAIFLPYYWRVYREDQRVAAESGVVEVARRTRKAVTVLLHEDGTAFLRDLEEALGYGVNPLQWADPDASTPELSEAGIQELAQRISDAPGASVLAVPDGTTVRVLSYR